jgi:hypothetical protein
VPFRLPYLHLVISVTLILENDAFKVQIFYTVLFTRTALLIDVPTYVTPVPSSLGIVFCHTDEDERFLRNVGNILPEYTASHARRQ